MELQRLCTRSGALGHGGLPHNGVPFEGNLLRQGFGPGEDTRGLFSLVSLPSGSHRHFFGGLLLGSGGRIRHFPASSGQSACFVLSGPHSNRGLLLEAGHLAVGLGNSMVQLCLEFSPFELHPPLSGEQFLLGMAFSRLRGCPCSCGGSGLLRRSLSP